MTMMMMTAPKTALNMYSSDGSSENINIYIERSSGAEVDEEGNIIHDQSRMMFYSSSTPSPLPPELPSEPHRRNRNRNKEQGTSDDQEST